MEIHQYSAGYVDPVTDTEIREFLVGVGMPLVPGIFTAMESESDPTFGGEADGVLLWIGYDTEGEGFYGVDCRSGEVFNVAEYNFKRFYVNSSPQRFAQCLTAFREWTSRVPCDADPVEFEEISKSLGGAIAQIDPTALCEDPGFWGSLLFDVANGDYCNEG
jgi:SUKH-4 immunity protein